ncbi:hypothetical protein WDU94_004947 [Cyamophila willieti]
MRRKHPLVIEKGRMVDMSDVMADPLVRFHEKHFIWFKLVMCFIVPTVIPCYFWGESILISVLMLNFLRYIVALNFTWAVNSAAHIWGNKPFDERIMPAENRLVSILALGEGWHNYHHVFPWDYKAAELGNYSFNITTMFIDLFAKIGWAYDRKQPSAELVRNTALRHGDGTYEIHEVQFVEDNETAEDKEKEKCEVSNHERTTVKKEKTDENQNCQVVPNMNVKAVEEDDKKLL